MSEERELFADEQAYIAWKRQQEAEAKAEARKAMMARTKRRHVGYSARIRRALANLWARRRRASIYADPLLHEAYRQRERELRRRRRQSNPEHYRAKAREYYRHHASDVIFKNQVYYYSHRDERLAWHREYAAAHREENRECSRRYRAEHHDELASKQRQYHWKNREARNAQSRAYHQQHRDEERVRLRIYRETHREELRMKAKAEWAALSPEAKQAKNDKARTRYLANKDKVLAKQRARRAARKVTEVTAEIQQQPPE